MIVYIKRLFVVIIAVLTCVGVGGAGIRRIRNLRDAGVVILLHLWMILLPCCELWRFMMFVKK